MTQYSITSANKSSAFPAISNRGGKNGHKLYYSMVVMLGGSPKWCTVVYTPVFGSVYLYDFIVNSVNYTSFA